MADIQVRHIDGQIEVLSLVGDWLVSEPNEGKMWALYNNELGIRHFFNGDGSYDGWELEMNNAPIEGDPQEFIAKFAEAIDKDRRFLEGPEQQQSQPRSE